MRSCPISAALLLALSLPAFGDEPKRVAAGKLITTSGTILVRKPTNLPWDWEPAHKGAELLSADLLIGLPDATLESPNGAVRLTMRTDLHNRSPLPIVETAIRLLPPEKDVDLDLWLDRGRIDVTNVKKSGTATVRVHFRTRVWNLTLEKPGTRIAMEIYGRFPPGTRFHPDPKEGDGPVASVLFVVLQGEVQRACPNCSVHMTAPPGPAQFGWDSIHGDDRGPKKLTELPDWAKEADPNSPQMKLRQAAREVFRKTIVSKGLGEALVDLLDSKEPEHRRVGVYALGAFDQLQSLGSVLARSKDLETWNNAVIAMRHWLGRAPGQDRLLYTLLMTRKEFTAVQARNLVQLLMGFNEEDISRPELYQLLINALKHDKLAIRGLAYWHLTRLAPAVKVKFNPSGDEAERERAWKEFKAAIPDGKLPPERKPSEEKK